MSLAHLKYSLKKIIAQIHLWLGLIAGIVICVSMLGASIYVWQEELTNWYYRDIIFNDIKEPKQALPLSKVHQKVSSRFPGKEFTFLLIENEPERNYAWRSYKKAEKPGITWPSGIEHYLIVYINPYTGKITGHIDKRTDWITLTRFLHQTLLLEYDLGTSIIGVAGLIMIVMAISGLILWLPKKWKQLKHRLRIKWRASFKRINWDFHSVGGFYTFLFILFFASTGLVWSYSWWKDGIIKLLGDQPEEVFNFKELPEIDSAKHLQGMDVAFNDAMSKRSDWNKMYFSVPFRNQEKGKISAGIYYDNGDSWWVLSDYFHYDPNTGALYETLTHDEKLVSEKWRHSNYDMHVGSIYGVITKIIACICALFFATLPISGFLIWWGRHQVGRK